MERDDILVSITQLQNNKTFSIFRIFIEIPFIFGWIEQVKFHISSYDKKQEFPMKYVRNTEKSACFENIIVIENKAIYRYAVSFKVDDEIKYHEEENWKMSVGFEVPEWAKGAVMYHVFVDRYRRSPSVEMKAMPKRTIHAKWDELPTIGPDESGVWNIDFFGGNLKGITETLSYIKSLGVTVLYLSPIMKSQSNHRYDTADYEEVDYYAGTNEDLKELCEVAHQKGMKVVLDAVFNHTGNDSKYFNQYGTFDSVGAYQSEDSPYSSFYKTSCENGKKKFHFWWGMKNLPECDGNSKEWKEYILGEGGVIDKWFDLGIDGLRLDVADELTDEFIEGITRAVKRNKEDGLVLGEVWKNPMRMNRGYIGSGKGMHSVMNYLLVDALIRYYKYGDVEKLNNVIKEIQTEYPTDTINALMNFTSTHDISRAIEIFGCNTFQVYGEWAWNLIDDRIAWIKRHEMTKDQYKEGKKVLKSYVSALAFLPGILSIFYGDEVGIRGIGNLANRKTYPWTRRDKDLLYFFRKIGKMRKEQEFLKNAELKILKIDDNQIWFERFDAENKILFIASRVDCSTEIKIPEEYSNAEIIFSIANNQKDKLAPYGAIALKK